MSTSSSGFGSGGGDAHPHPHHHQHQQPQHIGAALGGVGVVVPASVSSSSSSAASTGLSSSGSGGVVPGATLSVSRVPASKLLSVDNHLRRKYEVLLQSANAHPERSADKLHELRKMILLDGIPRQTTEEIAQNQTKCSLRGRIWKALLGVRTTSADQYIALIKKGPAPPEHFAQIEKDLDRTFKNDPVFTNTVPVQSLRRVLNAFVYTIPDHKIKLSGYVQGMNLYAACLLHVMPELDAFHTLCTLLHVHLPMYFVPSLPGGHEATKLFTVILKHVDIQLYNHLKEHQFNPPLAFQPLISLCTSTPPFEQALQLWDYFFALGVHLSVPTLVAQLVLNRTEILSGRNGFHDLPPLNKIYVDMANSIVLNLPPEVWELLCKHTREPIQIPISLYDPNEFTMKSGTAKKHHIPLISPATTTSKSPAVFND
ncbi:bub2 protein [Pelomyxa schiedti]|nr:bub2 protein [Pelomyxa schiedti]